MRATAIQIEHLAMATRWRLVLRGRNPEELAAVGDACTVIIDDWDRTLSRFNSTSEVSRINRAPLEAVLKLHPPLLELIHFCDHARRATQGLFEVALSLEKGARNNTRQAASYSIEPKQGTFRWLEPHHQLDFGGIAKGFVVDRLLEFVKQQNVTAALFDAGGSSLLAWDSAPDAEAWQVMLSDPGEGPRELIVGAERAARAHPPRPWLELQNNALAYSATRLPGAPSGQTVDPRVGLEIAEQRACVVLAQAAAWAEVLSTAALCMGEAEAATYIKQEGLVASRLGWLSNGEVHWYSSHG